MWYASVSTITPAVSPQRTTQPEQVARHLDDRPVVEAVREGQAGCSSSSARACASCSRTRSSAVPPSETFDSSHDWRERTS